MCVCTFRRRRRSADLRNNILGRKIHDDDDKSIIPAAHIISCQCVYDGFPIQCRKILKMNTHIVVIIAAAAETEWRWKKNSFIIDKFSGKVCTSSLIWVVGSPWLHFIFSSQHWIFLAVKFLRAKRTEIEFSDRFSRYMKKFSSLFGSFCLSIRENSSRTSEQLKMHRIRDQLQLNVCCCDISCFFSRSWDDDDVDLLANFSHAS